MDPTDEDEIRKSFQRLSKKYHPDKFKGVAAKRKAESNFKKITEAYNWLIQQKKAA
jgi:DnaJ-class molecular chaperone